MRPLGIIDFDTKELLKNTELNLSDYDKVFCKENNALYDYDPESTLADDGDGVLTPFNFPGRLIKIGNSQGSGLPLYEGYKVSIPTQPRMANANQWYVASIVNIQSAGKWRITYFIRLQNSGATGGAVSACIANADGSIIGDTSSIGMEYNANFHAWHLTGSHIVEVTEATTFQIMTLSTTANDVRVYNDTSAKRDGSSYYLLEKIAGFVSAIDNSVTVSADTGNQITEGSDGGAYITGTIKEGVWTNLNLSAGWSNFGAGYTPAQYKMEGKNVYVRGLVRNTSGGTMGTNSVVAIIPLAAQPTYRYLFNGICNSSDYKMQRIDVNGNGQIIFVSTSIVANGWVALDGIAFSIN